jgi:hypothetical protein
MTVNQITSEIRGLETERMVQCFESLILGLSEDGLLEEVFERMKSKPRMTLFMAVNRVRNG